MGTQAVVFPGQGAQLVGMGQDVAAQHPAAASVFEQADEILGFKISTLCFEGPAERLNATDIQQPAIFTTSVALYRAAVDVGLIDPGAVSHLAGLSLGEYTALHIGGALEFADALRLVQRRGTLMQQAAEQSDGSMVSILGASEAQVLALCEAVAEHGPVGPANFNCKGQIVISGAAAACEAAATRAEEFDGKAIPLKVAGAFHSELMRPAAEALRAALADAAIQPPQTPVAANVDAGYHGSADEIRDALYRQVFYPVRWQMCVERLIADGCTHFWEVGPNKVLTGLMRKINRDVKTVNVSTAAALTPDA